MKLHYLEIVASDVDAVCAAHAAAHGIEFGSPEPLLGGARTAPLPGGGSTFAIYIHGGVDQGLWQL